MAKNYTSLNCAPARHTIEALPQCCPYCNSCLLQSNRVDNPNTVCLHPQRPIDQTRSLATQNLGFRFPRAWNELHEFAQLHTRTTKFYNLEKNLECTVQPLENRIYNNKDSTHCSFPRYQLTPTHLSTTPQIITNSTIRKSQVTTTVPQSHSSHSGSMCKSCQTHR